jgi:hypothetical protein
VLENLARAMQDNYKIKAKNVRLRPAPYTQRPTKSARAQRAGARETPHLGHRRHVTCDRIKTPLSACCFYSSRACFSVCMYAAINPGICFRVCMYADSTVNVLHLQLQQMNPPLSFFSPVPSTIGEIKGPRQKRHNPSQNSCQLALAEKGSE